MCDDADKDDSDDIKSEELFPTSGLYCLLLQPGSFERASTMACSPVTKASVVLSVGLVVLIAGVVLGWYGFRQIILNVVKSSAVLEEGSETYDLWESSPIPIYMAFHIFHCTNAKDVLNGAKPQLVEKGPYVFQETRDKGNVSFQEHTVTYKEYAHYFFDEEKTGPNASLADNITLLNPIYVGLASYADPLDIGRVKLRLIKSTLAQHNEDLFMTQTVGDLLFHGWDITDWLDLYELVRGKVPELPDIPDRFMESPYVGLFQNNGSNDGEYVIHSGKGDYKKLGEILTWQNSSTLDYWNTDACNMINGTDGTLYAPLLDKNEQIYIFNSDLCRSIYLEYERDSEMLGIKTRRYTASEYVLANVSVNPENLCYCSTPETPENCYGASILDLRTCAHGAPILMSTPHFYQGDQRYIDALGPGSVNPQKDLHETFFELEPISSAPLSAAKRIQINIDLKKYSWISLFDINEVIYPIMWVDEYADIDQKLADDINDQLFGPINALKVTRGVLVGVGAFVTLVGSMLLVKAMRKRNEVV